MATKRKAPAHIREPQRSHGITFERVDDLVAHDHPARLLWDVLGGFDLAPFSARIRSTPGAAGRPQLSPRMVLTAWLYAYSQGVGSARHLAKLLRTDLAYLWIVGDLEIGHHKLSEFRAEHGEALNQLFTDVLAQLLHRGLISLDAMAQDGMRVRAAAGAASFRSYGSLLECRQQAELHLKAVLAQVDSPAESFAVQARREAAARDFQQRVEQAIKACVQQRHDHPERVARGSTTDAEARVMKMADGGFRPGLNVQFGTVGKPTGGPRTIVAVRVTNVGSDLGSLLPMVDQVHQRLGQYPRTVVADSNHAKHDDLIALMALGIEPVVTVPSARRGQPRGEQADQREPIQRWRERMAQEPAKSQARARASVAELANAWQKSKHGLTQALVRGAARLLNVMLLGALAMNLLQHAPKLLADGPGLIDRL